VLYFIEVRGGHICLPIIGWTICSNIYPVIIVYRAMSIARPCIRAELVQRPCPVRTPLECVWPAVWNATKDMN